MRNTVSLVKRAQQYSSIFYSRRDLIIIIVYKKALYVLGTAPEYDVYSDFFCVKILTSRAESIQICMRGTPSVCITLVCVL